MKLGAQFYTLRERNKTPEGLYNSFKRVKEIGYQVVQMSAICQIEAERLKSFSDEFELPITVTHSAYDRIVNDTDALIKELETKIEETNADIAVREEEITKTNEKFINRMRMDYIHHDSNSQSMGIIHKRLELFRSTETRTESEEIRHLIAE